MGAEASVSRECDMSMRRFVAPTARDCLRKVKEELGPDAIVVSNKPANGGVEIMAMTSEGFEALSRQMPLREVSSSSATRAASTPAPRATLTGGAAQQAYAKALATPFGGDVSREPLPRFLKTITPSACRLRPASRRYLSHRGPLVQLPQRWLRRPHWPMSVRACVHCLDAVRWTLHRIPRHRYLCVLRYKKSHSHAWVDLSPLLRQQRIFCRRRMIRCSLR